MILPVQLWAAVGAIVLAAGTLPSVYFALTEPENRNYYGILAAITAIAAVSYTLTSQGIGTISVDGASFYVPRYVDWLLTTPLLLLYMALLCKPGKQIYGLLIGLDVALILLGTAAIFTEGTLSLVLFGAGTVAYLALAYVLVVTLPARAAFESDRVEMVFTKLRNVTVVLWTMYPVVWLLAPVGYGYLLPNTEMMVIVYLDIITKVGFAIFALLGRDALNPLSDEALAMDTGGEGESTANPNLAD
jgi:sensory rhodopsin